MLSKLVFFQFYGDNVVDFQLNQVMKYRFFGINSMFYF